jgi:hypothetical protein
MGGKKRKKMHFHNPVNEINDAAKEKNYFLVWTEVECRNIRQSILVPLRSNIAAMVLNQITCSLLSQNVLK